MKIKMINGFFAIECDLSKTNGLSRHYEDKLFVEIRANDSYCAAFDWINEFGHKPDYATLSQNGRSDTGTLVLDGVRFEAALAFSTIEGGVYEGANVVEEFGRAVMRDVEKLVPGIEFLPDTVEVEASAYDSKDC